MRTQPVTGRPARTAQRRNVEPPREVVAPPRAAARPVPGTVVLAALLLVPGWIHLELTPEHLAISPILGAGFGLSAVVQLGLAAIIGFGSRPLVVPAAIAAIGVNVVLIALYAYAVLVGLPFEAAGHEAMAGHAHEAAGLALGRGEPVDALGGVTFVAEMAGAAQAIRLLRRGH